MFKNLFNKSNQSSETKIVSPVNGVISPLEAVPDPVFSEKMMGEGIAITPTDGYFLAPVDGEIVQLPDSKHAYGIRSENGLEILVHIGLETVSLKGEGFDAQVKAGDTVKAGDPVITCDLDFLKNNVENTITPIVITNTNDIKGDIAQTKETTAQASQTVLITVSDQ